MKDSHLTLRLSRELARALARLARDRGLPKSQVAREAVTEYLAPAPARNAPLTAAGLAARWPDLPPLDAGDAAAFAADLAAARRGLPAPRDAWE